MNTTAIMPHPRVKEGVLASLQRSSFVWMRNRDVFLRLWKANVGAIIVEPMLVLLAMGFGLGSYIESVGEHRYIEFLAPGLLASYAMFASVLETTFGTYFRMETHRTFDGILQTPVSVQELVQGELLWAGTRSLMHAAALLAMASAVGLIESPYAILALPISVLVGVMFGSIAILATSLAPSINLLENFFSLFVIPMFFFSGVFYPLDRLPDTIQTFAWFVPLTPVAHLMRNLAFGNLGWNLLADLGIMAAFTALFLPLSVKGMQRRLVK